MRSEARFMDSRFLVQGCSRDMIVPRTCHRFSVEKEKSVIYSSENLLKHFLQPGSGQDTKCSLGRLANKTGV